MTEINKKEELKRELGVVDIAASLLNITVGSGIFLLPALVAAILGPASLLAYLGCGAFYLCLMLCFAEMSSRITNSGGSYIYIEKAFGPFAGFIANNLSWLCGILISAALVNGIADMLSLPFPIFQRWWLRFLLFAVLIGYTCYSNITGVKQSMNTAKTLVVLKMLPLLLIVVAGIFSLNFNNIKVTQLPSAADFGSACLLLSAAFVGGESAAMLGGEMKNPKRTGPLGILLGVVWVIVFYMLIQAVAQSVLGDSLALQTAPLAKVADVTLGGWATTMILVGGIISIFGTLYSCIMSFSRVMYAGAFNNALPKFLDKVHPTYATPHRAIIAISLLAFILACTGGYRYLIVVATISVMFSYVGVLLALIKFKLRKDNLEDKKQFRIPGGILIPAFTLLATVWLLWHSKMNEITGIIIFIAILSVIYLVKIYASKKNSEQLSSIEV